MVLVRKQFPTKGERKWLLKQMDLDERYSKGPGEGPAVEKEREERTKRGTNKERAEADVAAAEYEEFMEELEHDRDMRKHINLYKKPRKVGRFKGEKGARTAVDLEGASSSSHMQGADGEDEDQWEDVADGEDDDDDDVHLDELLDEMVVSEKVAEQVELISGGVGAPMLSVEEAEEEVKRGGAFVSK